MNKVSMDWQEFTKKAMVLAGVSQSEMARILSKKLGKQIAQSQVQMRISHPTSKAPRDEKELNVWADTLRLEGFHRQTFMRLAMFERTPVAIRKQLLEIEDQVAKQEKRLIAAEQKIPQLHQIIDSLTAQLAENTASAASLVQRFDS